MRLRDSIRLTSPVLRPMVALAIAALCAGSAHADQISLPSILDNTLYQNTNGSLSNGAGSGMFAGRNATAADQIRRAVVLFDIPGSIPAGSTINNVELHLYMNQTVGGEVTVTVHRLLASWGEGASVAPGGQGSGGASAPNDATWKHRFFPGINWGTLGGDFGGSSASAQVDQPGSYVWTNTPQFQAEAQFFLSNPGQNFGWILRGDEVFDGSAKRFATKEYPTADLRPTLIVNYTPPGVPAVPATWGRVKGLYRD